jgi:hypothetical protein
VNLIGLTGYSRSGKDTVAEMLRRLEPGSTRTSAFSDLVKLSAARSLGVLVSPDHVGTRGVREWANRFKTQQEIQIVEEGKVVHTLTGRAFLQRYGTEAHRDIFGDDFWVDQLDLQPEPHELLVFTDVRFDNEAAAIRAAGGEVWLVTRAIANIGDGHRSEQLIDPTLIDREIPNNGTLDDLKHYVELAYKGQSEGNLQTHDTL